MTARSFTSLVLLSLIAISLGNAAERISAKEIAANLIDERADQFLQQKQVVYGNQLHALANALRKGHITLDEAALVMQIAGEPTHRSSATPRLSPEQQQKAKIAATHATAILDGDTPPAPAAPVAAAAATPPAPVTPSNASANAETLTVAVPHLTIPTSVVTTSKTDDGKTTLVLIGVGENEGIAVGQRFIVKRKDEQLAVISATKVNPTMTICIAIAGTIADGVEIKAGDLVISEEEVSSSR